MDIFEEKRQLIEKIACQKEDTLESKLELKQLLLKDTNGGKLYKYRSFDKDGYSLKNLEEGTLHCSLVEAFNDPLLRCILQLLHIIKDIRKMHMMINMMGKL